MTVPCVPDDHSNQGAHHENLRWVNWAGRVSRDLPHLYEPLSRADLVAVVREVSARGGELHAEGSRWAFEDLAVSADAVVNLAALRNRLDAVVERALTDERQRLQSDPQGAGRLFHVEAGIKIAQLNQVLADAGLAMPTLGGANGQSLAGAITTGTHGGDIVMPPLPDLVQAIHLVTAEGKEIWIERASEPLTTDERLRKVLTCPELRIRRDDKLFDAVLVSAGRFGVVYSLVLEVVPAFRLAEFTVSRPTAELISLLRSGVDDGTGLTPLLDSLGDPPPELGADTSEPTRFLEILAPSSMPANWRVRRRWATRSVDDLAASSGPNPLCGPGWGEGILAMAAAALEVEAVLLSTIPLVGAVLAVPVSLRAIELRAHMHATPSTGEALALSVNALWQSHLGAAVGPLNDMLVGQQYADSSSTGRRGPGHLIMTGNAASNDICYRAESVEVIFSATTRAYLDFLERIVAVAPKMRQAGYISLRYGARSRALLSMHNLPTRILVAIEVSALAGLEDNGAWLGFVERTAVEMGGRAHWGQQNHLSRPLVEQTYGDALTIWRESLRSVSGADRTFSNDFTRRCGLEPVTFPGEPTVRRVRIDRYSPKPGGGGKPDSSRVFELDELAALEADLGALDLGQSRMCEVFVENAGAGRLQLETVTLDTEPPDAMRVDSVVTTAKHDESALLVLSFAPSRIGSVSGTLTVTTNAPAARVLRIELSASAHGSHFPTAPSALDFGQVDVGERAARTLELTNTGDRPGTLFTAAADSDGIGAPAAFDVGPAAVTVLPGGRIQLWATFAPTRGGSAHARLHVWTQRGQSTLKLLEAELTGEGLAPFVRLAPAHLDFPAVPLRRASLWQSVEVANRGTGALRISGIATEGEVQWSSLCPPVLTPGQTGTVLVRFRPVHAGDRTGRLLIAHNAPDGPSTVPCTGIGTAVPLVLLEPDALDFPAQKTGTTGSVRTVRLTNDGVSHLHPASCTVTGPDAADFAVVPPGLTPAGSVPPEGRREVAIAFTPSATGARSAALRVDSDADGSPHTVRLTGVGLPPGPWTVTPTMLPFGALRLGSVGEPAAVTVRNTGQAPVRFATLGTICQSPGEFAVVGGSCRPGTVLTPGEEGTVELRFAPAALGPRTGELHITEESGATGTVLLEGTGSGPQLVLEPAETDFGLWAVGSPSPDLLEVRLRNLGNIPLRIGGVGIEGDFIGRESCAGNTLPAGGSCTVRLRFLPTAEGLRTGRIVAVDDDGRTYTALLHGMGGAPHFAVEPAALTFGAAVVGSGPVLRTLTVTNTGTWPLTLRDPQIQGRDAADFTWVDDGEGAVLRAGASRGLHVSFTPTASAGPGNRTATLRLTSNADPAVHEIPAEGVATT
ncbi:choice-of-anchor D domain-containing protein [Streptomyces chartreusis]